MRGSFSKKLSVRARPRTFLRDTRGGAAIELALGSVVLLMVGVLCFDLYSRVDAETASLRLATTMADYVSRDTETKGPDLVALGEFLYRHELGVPAELVYVISALRRQSASEVPPEVEVLWSSADIRVGDDLDDLADDCSRYVDGDGDASLPDGFVAGMEEGEVMVVAEVCARLLREGSLSGSFIGGVIYHSHGLPVRDPEEPPSTPVFTSLREAGAVLLQARSSAPGAPGFAAGLDVPPMART